jgi:cellulose synthase/poly-beta-1,6-N-acetylglucosamine synthase-like glycosyltransferase
MMEVFFWSTVGLVIYIYIGYPALVYTLAGVRKKSVKKGEFTPNITIIIAAYNEEKYIGATIENKMSLDYPRDKLEIIVVSDESSDHTDSIVTQFVERARGAVKFLCQSPRKGKTAALNMAVQHAKGDILIFSDANSIYRKEALRALTRNFSDDRVGYVTGKMIYTNPDGSTVGDGCSAFMKYENALRFYETELGSIVGVDGGIDAIRRILYKNMRADQLPDFVLPLSVVEQGYRVVYEPEAILTENALEAAKDEYSMRVRVALRAFWAMYSMRKLFNPLKYGIYSWQMLSHKALRYMAFLPLIILLTTNTFLLWGTNVLIYQSTFSAQCVFYLLAVVGKMLEENGRKNMLSTFAYYFVLLNIASAHAFLKFARGKKQIIWRPRTG